MSPYCLTLFHSLSFSFNLSVFTRLSFLPFLPSFYFVSLSLYALNVYALYLIVLLFFFFCFLPSGNANLVLYVLHNPVTQLDEQT